MATNLEPDSNVGDMSIKVPKVIAESNAGPFNSCAIIIYYHVCSHICIQIILKNFS